MAAGRGAVACPCERSRNARLLASRDDLALIQSVFGVTSVLTVRTKPQAPRPLQHWLSISFEAGIGCESQEVNRRMLKQRSSRDEALNSANSELQCSPIKKKAIEIPYI